MPLCDRGEGEAEGKAPHRAEARSAARAMSRKLHSSVHVRTLLNFHVQCNNHSHCKHTGDPTPENLHVLLPKQTWESKEEVRHEERGVTSGETSSEG